MKGKKLAHVLILVGIFFVSLFIFTLAKFPEAKLTAVIQGYLQQSLDPFGILETDQGREFSVFKGFQYKLIHPVFELSDQTRIELDEVTAAPSLLSLLMFKPGATVELKQGASSITATAAARGDQVSISASLNEVNFGKLGLLMYLAQIKGGGIISGDFKLDGTVSDLNSLSGKVDFKLKSVQIDEQSIMGMLQLKKPVKIAEGIIDIKIEQGKVVLNNVALGKPNSKDDLNVLVKGDITLKKNVNSSELNLKAYFGISDSLKQDFGFLETLLTSAKQTDGRYAYKISGPLSAPLPPSPLTESANK